MNRKITVYTNKENYFDEIKLKYCALNDTEKLTCVDVEPRLSSLGKMSYSVVSYKNPFHKDNIRFKELNYSVADMYTEEKILNDFADVVSEKFVPCIIEYSMSNDENSFLFDFDKKINDISGINSAIKFSASAKEIIEAYNDILNMFDEEQKLLTNIQIGFPGSDLIEIRYEIKGDPDFEVLLKDFLKKHPNIRVLSVTSAKKRTEQMVLFSGNGTHKIKTKKITYERSWDSDYNHLKSKFSLWGDSQFHDQDIYFKEDNSVLCWINDFNWNEKIDLSSLSNEITTIGKKAFMGNKYIKEIILPVSLKKIEKEAFAKCSNLKHIYFNSEPDIEVDVFDGCKNLTIHAPKNGKVESYSQENTIAFAEK